MAKNVQSQICGGDIKKHEEELRTVGDVRAKLGLGRDSTATVNGEPAEDGHVLRNFEFVGFAKATAGGI